MTCDKEATTVRAQGPWFLVPIIETSVNLWAHKIDYARHLDTEINAGGEWSPRLGGRVSLRCYDVLEAAAGGSC